jgi:pimeloyl-ACP methyl ester carboxylesterase
MRVIPGIDQKRCSVAGHDLVYYRAGQGEPVLLVHGITTYSFIWRNILSGLAQSYDVIAVDLLGCGQSDMPLDVSYAIKDHADILHGFVQELGFAPFHFVGHDLGGGMGQIFAIKHADLLRDLALINPVAYDFWPVQPITAMRTPIVRQLLMAALDKGMLRRLVKRGVYDQSLVTDELMEFFNAPFKDQLGRKAFLHFARCLDNHNLMEIAADLRELQLPVLVLRADGDLFLSGEIAQKLHRELPNSTLVQLAQAGHFCQEDDPARVTSELLSFFGSHHA